MRNVQDQVNFPYFPYGAVLSTASSHVMWLINYIHMITETYSPISDLSYYIHPYQLNYG